MTTSAKKGKNSVVAAKGKSFQKSVVITTQTNNNNSRKLLSFQSNPTTSTVSKVSLQVPKLTSKLFFVPLIASSTCASATTPKVTPIKKSTHQPIPKVASIPKKVVPKVIPISTTKPITKKAPPKPAATIKAALKPAATPKGSPKTKPAPKGYPEHPPKEGYPKDYPKAAVTPKGSPKKAAPKVSSKHSPKAAPNAITPIASPKKPTPNGYPKNLSKAAATKAAANATAPKGTSKKPAPKVALTKATQKLLSTKPFPKLPLSKNLFKVATPTIPKVAENLSTLNTALNALSSIKGFAYQASLHSKTNKSKTVVSKEVSIVASPAKKSAKKTVSKTTTVKATSVNQSFTLALSVNVTSPTAVTPTTNSKSTTVTTTKDTKPSANSVASKSKNSPKKKKGSKKSSLKKAVVKKVSTTKKKSNKKKKKVVSSANASIMKPSSKNSTNKVTVKKVCAIAGATENTSQPPAFLASSENYSKKISSPGTAAKAAGVKQAPKKVIPKKPVSKKIKAPPPKASPASKTIKKQRSVSNKKSQTAGSPKTVQNIEMTPLIPALPTMNAPIPINAQDNQEQGNSSPQAIMNHYKEFFWRHQQQQQLQYQQYRQHLMMQQTLPYGLANSYPSNHIHPTQWMNSNTHPPQNPYVPYSTTVADPSTTRNSIDSTTIDNIQARDTGYSSGSSLMSSERAHPAPLHANAAISYPRPSLPVCTNQSKLPLSHMTAGKAPTWNKHAEATSRALYHNNSSFFTNMLDRPYMDANPYFSNTFMPTNGYGGNLNTAGTNPYAEQSQIRFQPNTFTGEMTATIDSANNNSNSKTHEQHDSEEDDYEWCNSHNDSSGYDNSRSDCGDKKNKNIAPKQYFVKKEDAVYYAGIAADTEPRDAAEAYLLSQLKDMGFMDKREILSSIRRLQKQHSNSFGSYPSSDEVMCDIIGQRENAEEALKEDAARKLSEQTRKEEAKQHREIERQKDEDMLNMATLDDWKTNNSMFPLSWVLDLIIRTHTNLTPVQEFSNPNATGVTSTTRATDDSITLGNAVVSWSVLWKDPVKSALLQLLKIEKKAQKWYGLDLPKCYFTTNVFDSIRKAMSVEDVDREKCVTERIHALIETLNRIMFDLSEQSNDVPRAFLKVYDEQQTLVRASIGTESSPPEEVTPSTSLNSDVSADIEDDDSVVCLVAYPPTTNSTKRDDCTSREKIQSESSNYTDRMVTLGVEIIEIE